MTSDATSIRDFGPLTVRVDRATCIGTAACRNVAPEVFDLDADGIIAIRDDAPQEVERERLLEACRVCPVDALEVVEDGRQLVP